MNNELYGLLGELDLPEHSSSQQQIDHMYHLVMEKAGLPHKRQPRRPKTLLLIAAIVTTGLLALAAGYFSASDAFRGHLNEQGAGGEVISLSGASALVDRSGKVLDVSAISDNIEISARAIAGDDSVFVVLFDIEDMAGRTLGLLQQDGTVSKDQLYFGKTSLSSPAIDEVVRGSGVSVMDSSADGSSGTLLLRVEFNDPVPMGETVRIDLSQLLQYADLPGRDVGLKPGELYSLLSQFPEAAEEDFRESGYYISPDGREETTYALEADSTLSIPLPGPLEGYTITNFAVRHGKLYLCGYAPPDSNSSVHLGGMAIVNPQTSEVWDRKSISSSYSDATDTMQSWSIRFEDLESLEQLRDCVLYVEYGMGMHLLSDGAWRFDVTLDYQNATRYYKTNLALDMYGNRGAVTSIQVSPFRMQVVVVPEDSGLDGINDSMDYLMDQPLQLQLKDGSLVEASSKSAHVDFQGEGESETVRSYVVASALDAVVDPDLIEYVLLGDARYSVQ